MMLMTPRTAEKVEKAGNDLRDVCQMISDHVHRRQRLIPKNIAIIDAKRMMKRDPHIRSVQCLVWNADDSVDLIKIGNRGGVTKVTSILDKKGNPV